MKPSEPMIDAKTMTNWHGYTLLAIGLILIFRIISLYFNETGLFFDEAQYWLWGKEPDFGYFSKPPMLGWIIAFFTWIFASDSEFIIRLPSALFHTLTAYMIYLSALKLFDSRTGFWSAIIYLMLPGITLSSTLISTDVPLLFFWAGALWAFLCLRDNFDWSSAILLGLFVGLGLMSKYAMAYFFLCIFLYVLAEKSIRPVIFSTKFLLAVVIALLILSPNLYWNYAHQFITANHTGDNIGWKGNLFNPLKMAEFLGSQFGVFGPILFAFYLIAIVRFIREGWSKEQKFLVFFSLPVLALITLQALLSKAYANWAALTYIGATILLADILVNRVPPVWNKISSSIHGFIFVALGFAVMFSSPGNLTLPNGREPFERLHGWQEIAEKAGVMVEQNGLDAVMADHRHLTAELVYYLRDRSEPVVALDPRGTPSDHYQMTRPYQGQPEGAILLVARRNNTGLFEQQFNTITPLGSFKPTSGTLKEVWFFKLEHFTGAG